MKANGFLHVRQNEAVPGVIKLSGRDWASRPLAFAAAENERGAVVMSRMRNLEQHVKAVKLCETPPFFLSLGVFVCLEAFTIKQQPGWWGKSSGSPPVERLLLFLDYWLCWRWSQKQRKTGQAWSDSFAGVPVYLCLSSALTLRALKYLHTHKQAKVRHV